MVNTKCLPWSLQSFPNLGQKCQFGGFLRLPNHDFAAHSPVDFAPCSPPHFKVVQQKMPKNMDSRSETKVKIDYVGKAWEVLNMKGNKIAQLAQEICSLHFLNPFFGALFM